MKKLNIEEFIHRANEVHNNYYNYSLVKYVNSKIKINIICPKHGEFQQIPNSHLMGRGCSKCGGTDVKNLAQFIIEADKTHNNYYNYSLVKYLNQRSKINIICPKHGQFQQTPNSHLKGSGCAKCANNQISTTEDFIEKAKILYGSKYEYTKSKYVHSKSEIIITCPIHGDFQQIPNSHLMGAGCAKCANNQISTTEDFIEKAKIVHGNYYEYINLNYINAKTKVIISCPIHGEFQQIPNNHLNGAGCRKCNQVGAICNATINFLNKNRITRLYLVKFESLIDIETFYKIGISYSLKKRFSNREHHYRILPIHHVTGTLQSMFTLEQHIKNIFYNISYKPNGKMNGGHTECFNPINEKQLDEILELMNTITSRNITNA